MTTYELRPDRFECTLEECPPGLFVHFVTKDESIFGFKTEYGDCECFVVSSGEKFCSLRRSTSDATLVPLKKLMVIPVVISKCEKEFLVIDN